MTPTSDVRGAAAPDAEAAASRPAAVTVAAPPLPPLALPDGRRRAPRPVGPISGRRSWWRRCASLAMASVNRALDRLPPGRWLHAAAQRRLELHGVDVHLRRGGAGLDDLSIAFLSDLHAGSCMDEDDLARLFELVARHEPDLVCLGGDLINTREREILLYRRPLRLLRPPLGVHAVPGNHDHFYGDVSLWSAFLREEGVNVLINRGCRLERGGSALWLAGVDDLTEASPDLAAALAGWNGQDPVVLLSHHPDFFFEAAAVDVDLVLSGHTHGGQVKLFGTIPLKHSKFGYWEGHFREGRGQLYVSRGVGVTFLPLRIGAPPEIPIVRLRRSD
jgi:predicted MPP superfamily phosphohydrolase